MLTLTLSFTLITGSNDILDSSTIKLIITNYGFPCFFLVVKTSLGTGQVVGTIIPQYETTELIAKRPRSSQVMESRVRYTIK